MAPGAFIGDGGFTDDFIETARMLEDLRIRNYAPSTVRCYVSAVAQFAKHFNKSPDRLGPDEIRSWQLYLLNEKRFKLPLTFRPSAGSAFSQVPSAPQGSKHGALFP